MIADIFLLILAIAAYVQAYPSRSSGSTVPTQPNTSGFLDPVIVPSQEGQAVCVEGIVPIAASAKNLKLNLDASITRQDLATVQLILEQTYANTTIFGQVIGSKPSFQNISGTYNISARLCLPSKPNSSITTLQVLTHGYGFGKSYWDFGVNTSYVDYAASQGMATLAYDRLGIGNSSHPDAVNVVQSFLEISILHSLNKKLRAGALSNTKYTNIIGVGHSFGSLIMSAVAKSFPADFNAVVLTGYSINTTNSDQFTSSLNYLRANVLPRFADLPDGYVTPRSLYGMQYSFFAYPNFNPLVLAKAFLTAQTQTLGEQFTPSAFAGVATNFTGPVFIANGQKDIVFCDGNCEYPRNIPAESLQHVFPNAANTSSVFILPNAGHGLNLHLNANLAFAAIQNWIKKAAS